MNRLIKSRQHPEKTFTEINRIKSGSQIQSKELNRMIIYDTIYYRIYPRVYRNSQIGFCGLDQEKVCSSEILTTECNLENPHAFRVVLIIVLDNIRDKGVTYEITGDIMLWSKQITNEALVLIDVGCVKKVTYTTTRNHQYSLIDLNVTRISCVVNDLDFLIFHAVDQPGSQIVIFLCIALGGIAILFGIVGINDFFKASLQDA